MGKRLSRTEWLATKPPFVWIRLELKVDESQMSFIEKWLNERLSGWWYRVDEQNDIVLFAFEREDDQVMFIIWATNNPFKENHGEI